MRPRLTYQNKQQGTLPTMRKLIPLTLLALTLTGCTATATANPAEEPSNCVTVNDDIAALITTGIDTPDTETQSYAAAPSPTTDGLWYIAATWTGTNTDGEAVWIADADPATATTAQLMSVDAIAEAISVHPRIDGGTITAPGATEAINCLQ